jgi:glycosyltransferase involved in cell wall biosynthesis
MTSELRLVREGRRPLVSVVVPAYNESAIAARNLARLQAYLGTLEPRFDWELLIVDDGSTDGTGELAEAFAAGCPQARVLRHVVNLRLGQALRTAFANCRGDYVVTMDMDLSYSPEHIGRLLATLVDTKADIVIASPYMKGGRVSNVPWLRRKLSVWANRFLAYSCREHLSTITGMVRGYEGDFLRGLVLKGRNVDIHAEIIYKASILRARILEIPAHLDWGALEGRARSSSMRLGPGVAWNLLSGFMFRPFSFFIASGLLLLLLSLYPLGWALAHSIGHYADVARSAANLDNKLSYAVAEAFRQSPHSFVVGGFSLLAAIQLLSLGFLALQNHRYFKDLYHLENQVYRHSSGRGAARGEPWLLPRKEDRDGQG